MHIAIKPLAALVATCVLSIHPLVSLTEAEARKNYADSAAQELRGYLPDEVPLAELGDWPRSVNETLFMLFRKTELHRGRLEVRYLRSNSIVARLFPDGTVLLSTGLLDHIDVILFDRMASSARRVRSLEREREEALLPFLAPLAAETALDFGFVLSKEGRPNETRPDRSSVDRMTAVMLTLAGYETKYLETWLTELSRAGVPPALKDWASRFPAPSKRLASLASSSESITRLSAELAALLQATAVSSETRDILASAEAVAAMAGDIPYLRRLQALALHRKWLSTVSPSETMLITHIPVAAELDRSSEVFLSHASEMTTKSGTPAAMARAFANPVPVPGDAEAFSLAIDSYRRARATLSDGAFDSSYARLLAFAPTNDERKKALAIALGAAESEGDGDSPVARANLAALLFYSGTDRARARNLAERFAVGLEDRKKAYGNAEASPEASSIVRAGYPCDSRDIAINLAVMMKSLGEEKKADAYLARIRKLFADARSVPSPARASFRRLVPGDSVDSLVTFWGKPASIAYSYYSEWWEYPSLKARVLVAKESDGRELARFVTIGVGSPVSPGGNVRVGDALADFESEFGEAAYAVADAQAYLSGGVRFTVFAPFGTIRSISAGY